MKRKKFDFYYFITVMILLFLGLVMVLSASSEYARNTSFTGYNAYYFFKRQLLAAILGVFGMIALSFVDYHFWGKHFKGIWALSIILLIAVLVVGMESKGGKRWLGFGAISFEPSEAAKAAIIIVFAWLISRNQKNMKKFSTGIVPYMIIIGIYAILLLLQPHMSATLLIAAVGFIMIFVGNGNLKHLLGMGIFGVTGAIILALTASYRSARIETFLDPFKDVSGSGWQIVQSLYAIGSGGFMGLGLGQSRQKFSYIPEPHNDFIFAIICEELGFVGAVFTILVFCALIYQGIMIACHAKDLFGTLVATGITALIALEVIINIAVVTSTVPVTGMPLPFFSYGGSSLVIMLCLMGIMLNISSQSKNVNDVKIDM